ncbi:hypothetical protein [Phaeocystidibacter marisrubri]|uniref:Uncharacterized protein n=1 Tax=Phaeocystidibacter marisrubri TaxID=1577780 RepID=A0A6L3ZBK8_9FLAO|nr:hypothetical protein [Phaeocystidibacter marisrubri]KAB2815004.1 hypothetical protein F8C82_14650 [Phaeocystidibacter marisrubri]
MKRQIPIPTHHANGEPTHWPEMILTTCKRKGLGGDWIDIIRPDKIDQRGVCNEKYDLKIHHIVPADFECDPGDDIEFLAVTPEGEKFPFAPLVKCTSNQHLHIQYGIWTRRYRPWIDHSMLFSELSGLRATSKELEFAKNEGFESMEELANVHLASMNPFRGRLIHWTNKLY